MQHDPTTLAYLAGAIDADGHITVQRSLRKKGKRYTHSPTYYHPKIGYTSTVLCGVEKSQGLGKGGKVKRLGMIRVVDARQEPLRRMTDDLAYGFKETRREGFPWPHPKCDPAEFVAFFCASHRGVTPDSIITRIEFEHLEAELAP